MSNWITLLYTWNIVSQLYFNKYIYLEKVVYNLYFYFLLVLVVFKNIKP